MSAGQGYRYLLDSVVAGDGQRDAAQALTRYYNESGTPPGRWVGAGVAGFDGLDGEADITEEQLRRLMGFGQDPVTGAQLGRPYRKFATTQQRIERRITSLPDDLDPADRAEQQALIEVEEHAKVTGAPVAGFDLTFSAPKSVSTLWAVADAGTQALIARAHHAAMRDVIDLVERDVAMTRIGAAGPRGAVAQVEIRGVIGAAYDHYDSRAADPQLHTHVVVANRVQGAHDGKWRTLDSRALHAAVSGLSEHYNALLSDHLGRLLGVGWEARERGAGRMTAWEIAGVSQELVDEFSSRTRDIERSKDRLVAEYTERHGRAPSRKMLWQIRQQATLETRPEKQKHSLADLTFQWRRRAHRVLDEDPLGWARKVVAAGSREALLRADDVTLEEIDRLALVVVEQVADRRSTWRRWNLHAEAVRQTMDLRFASTTDREAVVGLIVDGAEAASLRLTPPELASSPARFRRADGVSVFRPKASTVYSSEAVLAAEDRLLALAEQRAAPTLDLAAVEGASRASGTQRRALSADQLDAIAKIAVSARVVDVLVGPAGAGKTTTMSALRRAWETEHGRGSVLGLAPSAAAAQVLGEELRIPTENTAKWLFEHRRGTWNLTRGQLVIVDEASLAGTFALDRLAAHAAEVGAKLLLVGDWAQLQAVDAGGAFGLLVRARDDAPELLDVRRFENEWEKHASLQLRIGDTDVIDTYLAHGRVVGTSRDGVLDAAYRAWLTDQRAGKRSVLIAEARETVSDLNDRARTDRILAGVVEEGGVRLHDGTRASRGDIVITRRNDRRLGLGRGWVKNNDRWIVTAAGDDGSLTIRREKSRWRTTLTLPAAYVAENVELGYAITAHRAQGATVDTAHAVVSSPEMTREALYVAMTRGRESNRVYVATDEEHLEEHQHRPDLQMTARSILFGILQHSGAELSAHEAITAEHDEWASIAQLAGEYDTIAQTAQHDRWIRLLEQGGLDGATIDELIDTDAYGILTTELRRLEAEGHNIDDLLPRVVRAGGLDGVDDLGSLLRYRVQVVTARYQPTARRRQLIAGLIPKATGPMAADMAQALAEREHHIVQRAHALATEAATEQPAWARDLGITADDATARPERIAALMTVFAYRDRYGIAHASSPLGPIPERDAERLEYERARAAILTLSSAAATEENSTPATTRESPTRGL
ncbi:MobF family relaxase [Microbacterium sp. NPDC077663]|uniref:MobF family relaxase n=1 Tax=Microbacterium sp. NPDC077663 TaxID=3364189 RepID=UPI0037C620AF